MDVKIQFCNFHTQNWLHKIQNPFLWTGVFLMCRLWCFSSVPPQLTESEDITVEEEAEFHLTCDIWANPKVSNVLWTVNGSSVDLEEIGLQFTNDGFKTKLSTWKAERGRHEGAYECSVTYFSEVYSKTFNVKLTGQLTVSVFWIRVGKIFKPFQHLCCRFNPIVLIFSTCR